MLKRYVLSALLSIQFLIPDLGLAQSSQKEPDQMIKRELIRTAETPLVAQTFLTKNIYKKVTVQVPYIEKVPYEAQEDYIVKIPYEAEETYYVDVPYQDTETYTEKIPYQDTETYIEEVPYQDTETYTEEVPYTERVAYQDTETYYENEYRCESVTRYRQECSSETRYRNDCRSEQECYLVPGEPGRENCQMVEECGTNSRGERVCKSRRVCQPGSPSEPRRECKRVEKCDRVPYTERVCQNEPYTDQECGYKSVPRTRTVTKYREETRYRYENRTRTVTRYRDETRTRSVTRYREETRTRPVTRYRQEERTRTVTRYRDETRTRTVTRYRDETRCCKPELVDQFDRQETVNVTIQFPENSKLIASEKEIFDLELKKFEVSKQVENKPKVDATVEVQITPRMTFFKYAVTKLEAQGQNVNIELSAAAKLNAADVGAETIELNLARNKISGELEIAVVDKIENPRFLNSYFAKVLEKESSQLVAELTIDSSSKLAKLNVDLSKAYIVQLMVRRESAFLIDGFAEFSIDKVFDKVSLTNEELEVLKDRFQIQIQDIQGLGAQTEFRILDQTKIFDEVSTAYRVLINEYQGSKKVRLSEKTFLRSEISDPIKLNQILNTKQIGKLKKGYKLQVHVIAKRKVIGPLSVPEIILERSKDIVVQ